MSNGVPTVVVSVLVVVLGPPLVVTSVEVVMTGVPLVGIAVLLVKLWLKVKEVGSSHWTTLGKISKALLSLR